MPRKRSNSADEWLPQRVYRGKSSYEYRPKGGTTQRLAKLQRVNGVLQEPPELKRVVLDAWEKAVTLSAQPKNVDYWLSRFIASERFSELAAGTTQKDYTRYIEIRAKSDDPLSRNGIRHVFGQMLPTAVKTHHIRKYLDYWGAAGKKSTANKHRACLLTFFHWLREQTTGVENNPADNMTPFKETSRAVYITDEHYETLLKAAFQSSTPYVAAVMEIAYLAGLRRHEVLQLNIEDVTDQGLFIRRGKGSKNEITEISPRLQRAIDFALSLHKSDKPEPLHNRPLIRNTRGDRVSNSALKNGWTNIREAAGLTQYTIHDHKKKAGTDGKDLGHMTKAMKAMYNLKPQVKKATK